MRVILQDKSTFIVQFDRGEEVLLGLKDLAEHENITAATFLAIGAAQELELAAYDIDARRYVTKDYSDKLEIASLHGNVAVKNGVPVIHAHGVFSFHDMTPVAGHINRLVVGVTCEVVLTVYGGTIERAYSEEIGLNLMK